MSSSSPPVMAYSEPSLKVPPLERAVPAVSRRRSVSPAAAAVGVTTRRARAASAAAEEASAEEAAEETEVEDAALAEVEAEEYAAAAAAAVAIDVVAPRGRARRAAAALRRGAAHALIFTLQMLLHLLFLSLLTVLRTAQLGSLALSFFGLPYMLSGPLLCLSLAVSAALISGRLLPALLPTAAMRRRASLREAGPAAALAADVALAALGVALLAEQCGCRGRGAPLPAGVYAAARAANAAALRASHAPRAVTAAYRVYTAACDALC
jgi:hypothetical protein